MLTTHLYKEEKIKKNDPRIVFRGKVDSLHSEIVLTQCQIREIRDADTRLDKELGELAEVVLKIMSAEVLQTKPEVTELFAKSLEQIHEASHKASAFHMTNADDGIVYAYLNKLRTLIRETEIAAIDAFPEAEEEYQQEIINLLNRLSSAVFVMMCNETAGQYL